MQKYIERAIVEENEVEWWKIYISSIYHTDSVSSSID